jgi:ribosome-associated translation inhibitor RaiA
MENAVAASVVTETWGTVSRDLAGFAEQRVGSVLRAAPEPVLFVRIKLTMSGNKAVRLPATAAVNVDLNGRLIRAQAYGTTMHAAIEEACDRLKIRLQRSARNWEARCGRTSAASRLVPRARGVTSGPVLDSAGTAE